MCSIAPGEKESTTTSAPSRTDSNTPSAPTTVGMPRDLARMAAWDVTPPVAAATPARPDGARVPEIDDDKIDTGGDGLPEGRNIDTNKFNNVGATVQPTSVDVAVWDNTVLAANTSALGASSSVPSLPRSR